MKFSDNMGIKTRNRWFTPSGIFIGLVTLYCLEGGLHSLSAFLVCKTLKLFDWPGLDREKDWYSNGFERLGRKRATLSFWVKQRWWEDAVRKWETKLNRMWRWRLDILKQASGEQKISLWCLSLLMSVCFFMVTVHVTVCILTAALKWERANEERRGDGSNEEAERWSLISWGRWP